MHNVFQGFMSTPNQRRKTRRQEEVRGRIPAINHINQGPAGTQLLRYQAQRQVIQNIAIIAHLCVEASDYNHMMELYSFN